MNTKEKKKKFEKFYKAFNEFMDWVGDDTESTGLNDTEPQRIPIPTLDDKGEILESINNRKPFNLEIITGDILIQAFKSDCIFRYRNIFRIEPYRDKVNLANYGFNVFVCGRNDRVYHFCDILLNEERLFFDTFDWDEYASYLQSRLDDLYDRLVPEILPF